MWRWDGQVFTFAAHDHLGRIRIEGKLGYLEGLLCDCRAQAELVVTSFTPLRGRSWSKICNCECGVIVPKLTRVPQVLIQTMPTSPKWYYWLIQGVSDHDLAHKCPKRGVGLLQYSWIGILWKRKLSNPKISSASIFSILTTTGPFCCPSVRPLG